MPTNVRRVADLQEQTGSQIIRLNEHPVNVDSRPVHKEDVIFCMKRAGRRNKNCSRVPPPYKHGRKMQPCVVMWRMDTPHRNSGTVVPLSPPPPSKMYVRAPHTGDRNPASCTRQETTFRSTGGSRRCTWLRRKTVQILRRGMEEVLTSEQ